jgi:DNA polymerase/3'-5' exonuclease PolX
MGSRFESAIDKQIREAQERGEFDNLPGMGKPLPNDGEAYDEDWWVKKLVAREQLAGLAPTSLKIKREAEELLDTVAARPSEQRVREIVADLNERIEQARRGLVDGPPVVLPLFDVEEVVAEWRKRRGLSA